MSSADALLGARPGVARGPYPERADDPTPFLARQLAALRGTWEVPRKASREDVARFAAVVADHAAGLEELAEAAFDRKLHELRQALRRSVSWEPLVPQTFALVREAARRSLGTPHYDVQLYGGWIMARQGLAELETGEGKTLTASLPASVAGLAGVPVHVITANDYLVARDAESIRPLYERLDLRVGVVVEEEPDRDARREAYACDVTYVTNKQVAFDYLQDRMAVRDGQRLTQRLRDEAGGGGEAVLRGLCFAVVDEADGVLLDDAGTPLILSRGGSPPDESMVRSALWLARSLEEGTDFTLDRRRGRIEVTDAGHAELAERARSLKGPLSGPRRREEWVQRALSALHIFQRDVHYLVRDDAVQTIDQPTGRRSPDRSFEGGMQALLEMREGVALSPQRETIARITYQRFFRRYLRLSGMTGTAQEVARELWDVYRLPTVRVPTRLPSRRAHRPLRWLPDAGTHGREIAQRVRELHEEGRPVLVGTASVGASEAVSARLTEAGLDHEVLNARQDADEARIIGRAGEPGRITVATRMAGRGTDIALGPGVDDAGGLAVVSTDLGEAGRIDRQLFGRCARQGRAGSYEQLVAIDDPVLERNLPAWVLRRAARGFPQIFVRWFTKRAQSAEERRGRRARRRLMESERALERRTAFAGRAE